MKRFMAVVVFAGLILLVIYNMDKSPNPNNAPYLAPTPATNEPLGAIGSRNTPNTFWVNFGDAVVATEGSRTSWLDPDAKYYATRAGLVCPASVNLENTSVTRDNPKGGLACGDRRIVKKIPEGSIQIQGFFFR